MKNTQFEMIYNRVKDISLSQEKKEYDNLKKLNLIDEDFDSYLKNNRKLEDKIIVDPEKQKKINDCIISKDVIEKDNFNFNIYLCKFTHVLPPKLENYEVLPLEKKTYYEYGCILEYNEDKDCYSINNIFSGIEMDEHFAKNKYNALKNKISNNSIDIIYKDINEYLDKIEEK